MNKKDTSTFEKIGLFIIIHIIIIALSIAITLLISYIFNSCVGNPDINNFWSELIAFIFWFILSLIINHFLVSTISCYSITSKNMLIYINTQYL